MIELNKIYNCDCLEGMKQIPDNSVNLIIIDPPYNKLSISWDKDKIDLNALCDECSRVIKDCGTLYIYCQSPIMFDIYNIFSKNFLFKQDLIWKKNRGFSLCNTIFTPYHENILYFVKNDSNKLIRFGKYIKEARKKLDYSLKNIGRICNEKWYHRGGHLYFETGLSKPTRKQYLKIKEKLNLTDDFDEILFRKPTFNFEDIKREGSSYKIKRDGQKLYGQKSSLGKYQSTNNGRNPPTVLEFKIVQSGEEYFGHPTTKPAGLGEYLIKASSNTGDIVLIPFVGTGSEIVKLKELNRNFIGFELSKEYCDISEKRLRKTQPLPPEVLKAKPSKLESFV